MVAISKVRASNVLFHKLPAGLISVFVGATSGIGLSTLSQSIHDRPLSQAVRIATVRTPNTEPKWRLHLYGSSIEALERS